MSDEWSDEARVTRLKKLWADGLSAGDIMVKLNHEFHGSFTRSAVIGKITRLKLPARNPALLNASQRRGGFGTSARPVTLPPSDARNVQHQPALPRREVAFVQKPRRNPTQSIAEAVALKQAEPGLAKYLDEPAIGDGIQMIQLNNHTCRWPFGDPLTDRFYFCGTGGANLEEKRPYCEFHTRKAAEKPRDPKAFHRSAVHAARR